MRLFLHQLEKIDSFLSKNVVWFTLLCLVLGVAFCGELAFLAPCTPVLFGIMTFCNTLGSSFRQIGGAFLHPVPILVTFGLMHLALPVLCLGLCLLLFPDAPLFTTGLVLQFSLPTGVLTLMWVTISRGNLPQCLSMVLLDTLLSPVVVPLTLKLLVGSLVKMDAGGMMVNLMCMVAIPACLALACHGVRGGETAAKWKPRLAPFSKLVMFVIIVSNATGVAPFLKKLTPTLLLVVAVLVGLNLLSYFLGYFVARRLMRLDFPSCETMTLNTGLRNISAGAVLATQYFPADVLFPVAFSPIFTQILLGLTVKLLRRTKAGQADQAEFEAAQRAREILENKEETL